MDYLELYYLDCFVPRNDAKRVVWIASYLANLRFDEVNDAKWEWRRSQVISYVRLMTMTAHIDVKAAIVIGHKP